MSQSRAFFEPIRLLVAAILAVVIILAPPLLLSIPFLFYFTPALGILAALGVIFSKRFLLLLTACLALIVFLIAGFSHPIGLSDTQKGKLAAMGEFISAEVFFERGQHDLAVEHYQNAYRQGIKNTWLDFQQGRCYLHLNQTGLAKEIFKHLMDSPDKFPLEMSLTSYSFASMKSMDFESGIAEYNKAIKYHIKPASAYYQLGIFYRRTDNQEKAKELITNAYKLGYDRSSCSSVLGGIAESQLNHQEAENYYRRAIKENHENLTAYTKLGSLLFRLGRYSEADEVLTEGVEILSWILTNNHREAAMLLNNLGFVRAQIGMNQRDDSYIQSAIVAYQGAMGTDPRFMDAYVNLADLFIKQGNYAAAEKVLLDALRVEPNNTSARMLYQKMLVDLGITTDTTTQQ